MKNFQALVMSKKVHNKSALATQLPLALKTGKYVMGFKQALKTVVDRSSKCLVISKSLPKMMRNRLEYYAALSNATAVKFYEGSNNDLAMICGLKYRAGVISVIDQGEASLVENKDN